MFTRSDLDELVWVEAEPAVSIYLPTHISGREIRQDPIRFKNLLSMVAEGLAVSRRKPEIDVLLAPAGVLVGKDDFWRQQGPGLAVFLAATFARVHRLPSPVPEEVYVGAHFDIRPLLPLLEDAGPYWLLTISAAQPRLYRGSRWNFAEVEGLDLPQGVGTIRGITEYEETRYGSSAGRHSGLAKAQSLGTDPDQARKDELLEFLRRIVPPIEPLIKRSPAPVILAADPQIQGHFREIARWKEFCPDGLPENPDAFTREELHHRAYGIVEQKRIQARGVAIDRLNARLGTGKATITLEEIVKAARHGQVDTLFLTRGGDRLWGKFDEAEDRVVAHSSATANDIDLVNYAALMTLRQGGSVMLVDRTQLPAPGLSAAILRY